MIPDLKIEVVRVGPVEVPLPRYQTPGSAGMDLMAAVPADAPLTIARGVRQVLRGSSYSNDCCSSLCRG